MPMKWIPENDQLLLLKILETHDLTVDSKKVAEAWPVGDGQTKPTPRAISERLVRMRKDVKSAGTPEGRLSIALGNRSVTGTPVKQRSTKSTPGPKTPTSGKRKRTQASPDKKNGRDPEADAASDAEAENNSEMDIDTPSKKPTSGVQVLIKNEPGDESTSSGAVAADADAGSPKRIRKPVVYSNMVGYASDTEGHEEVDGQEETSASEFMPDDSFESGVAVKLED